MIDALQFYRDLPAQHNKGNSLGITSVCSAHPIVIEAALELSKEQNQPALIEATCNQVNQEGGYTGIKPVEFARSARKIADNVGLTPSQLLLGGDHLGPNPWRKEPAEAAMQKACEMITAYAEAGFAKLHLDASMSCADDSETLPPEIIAKRAARLAAAAEKAASQAGLDMPGYIIGTEVPVPGGATEALDVLEVTSPENAAETVELHNKAFKKAGIESAIERFVGLVVQPGVEYGHTDVIAFDPPAANSLSQWRGQDKNLVFEAHSTDYQTPEALRALVEGGFAILKVGPGVTFALREALYGLDRIAGEINPSYVSGRVPAEMERIMIEAPEYWQDYYGGSEQEKYLQRHFSYSDRIRYYWNNNDAKVVVAKLMEALNGKEIPDTLMHQYLPLLLQDKAREPSERSPEQILKAAVKLVLSDYYKAC